MYFYFQAEDGIRDIGVTGVQTCALPICDLNVVRTLNSCVSRIAHRGLLPLGLNCYRMIAHRKKARQHGGTLSGFLSPSSPTTLLAIAHLPIFRYLRIGKATMSPRIITV